MFIYLILDVALFGTDEHLPDQKFAREKTKERNEKKKEKKKKKKKRKRTREFNTKTPELI